MCQYKIWRYQGGNRIVETDTIQKSSSKRERELKQALLSINPDEEIAPLQNQSDDYVLRNDVKSWKDVDREISRSIKTYQQILTENHYGLKQSTFVDLIIKLKICRAYANS